MDFLPEMPSCDTSERWLCIIDIRLKTKIGEDSERKWDIMNTSQNHQYIFMAENDFLSWKRVLFGVFMLTWISFRTISQLSVSLYIYIVYRTAINWNSFKYAKSKIVSTFTCLRIGYLMEFSKIFTALTIELCMQIYWQSKPEAELDITNSTKAVNPDYNLLMAQWDKCLICLSIWYWET